MTRSERARMIVREMERVTPYMYEGLYGNFLSSFMNGDRSKWSKDLSRYLSRANEDWAEVGEDVALVLWERFERRITC